MFRNLVFKIANFKEKDLLVSDRTSGEPTPSNADVGTVTDTFNGSLRSDSVFAGTVTTTYYRGNQICKVVGAFTLVRQTAADPNQTRTVALIDRPTFEKPFHSAPTEQAATLFEDRQKAIARQLDVPPPRNFTLKEVSQELYNTSQKTLDNHNFLYYRGKLS